MNEASQEAALISYFLDNGVLPRREEIKSYIKKTWKVAEVPESALETAEKTWQSFYELTPLLELLQDEQVREILIHSEREVQFDKSGTLNSCRLEKTIPRWNRAIARLLALRGEIPWNYAKPFQSFYLKLAGIDFRVTLLHQSLTAEELPKISLRKHGKQSLSLANFDLNQEQTKQFESFMQEKKNMLICGSTGSGKTSFLRALIAPIQDEHLITIEDTHEIFAEGKSQTSLVSTEKTSLEQLCSFSLRLRPDRLILGEIRGSEIIPFFMSMNTGHKGLLSTIHADSCRDGLKRAALLFSIYAKQSSLNMDQATKLICQNIDYVVHLKDRKVNEIAKVHGSDGSEPMLTSG